MRLNHPFDPIADQRSKVLVLGSFPSIKSFEKAFYYAHPRNQFWPIMEALFGVRLPDNESRRRFALEQGIALWDTYASLVRAENNSSDANLKALHPNDIAGFLKAPVDPSRLLHREESVRGVPQALPRPCRPVYAAAVDVAGLRRDAV